MTSTSGVPPSGMPPSAIQVDRAVAAQLLEAKFRSDIPITGAIDVRVREFSGDRIVLTAPLAPNVNVHGTGFAGSIYALGALCGWGLIFLSLREAGIAGSLVMTEATIRYARPITGELVATCDVQSNADFCNAMDKYRRAGRARFDLPVTIGAASAPAAELSARYIVRR